MGKQAKPKPASQKGSNQKKHNAKTRWINTKKPDLLWDPTLLYDIVEEELPDGQTLTKFVPKKREELEKRLKPPYDELLIDWEIEIQHFAMDKGAKISRDRIEETGGTRYTVYLEHIPGGRPKVVLLTVDTPQAANFGPKRHGKKRKTREEAAAPTP